MTETLYTLQNNFWQVGILPQTGAAVAFGRIRLEDGTWRDVLRPTAEANYNNPSKVASFIMLPWCNRIRDGILRFEGREYQLQVAPEDGTARHGVVRYHPWQVDEADDTHIVLSFDSAAHENANFPFHFSALADYRLEGDQFIWRLSLKNEDSQRFPAGFGHHPYFVRADDSRVLIPCDEQFELTAYMADAPPVPVESWLDFREMRPLVGEDYNHLLTHRHEGEPIRMRYPSWNVELTMSADPIFQHILLYTLPGDHSYAVEPMTNASDGFNLYERGIAESGVFVVEPGETVGSEVRLTIASIR